MFCNKEIRMSNDTGKWLPMNLDGGFHSCKKVEKDNNKDKQEPQIIINQDPVNEKEKVRVSPDAKAGGPRISA
jgi:hypothetical protein